MINFDWRVTKRGKLCLEGHVRGLDGTFLTSLSIKAFGADDVWTAVCAAMTARESAPESCASSRSGNFQPSKNVRKLAVHELLRSWSGTYTILGFQDTAFKMTQYSPVPQSPYLFDKLETETSFRVLELRQGTGEEPISCVLHIADWTQPPEYEAVSYAWGDHNLKAPIKCNGKRLEVGRNLHSGLSHLRLANKSRYLWVDCLW